METNFGTIIREVDKARKGLAAFAVLVVCLTAACFSRSEDLLRGLVGLLGRKVVAYSPDEAFLTLLSLSLYCGLALSLPVGAWLLWRFAVARRFPGLKRWGAAIVLLASALFLSGVLLGFYVLLPAGIGFLVGFETERVTALISARKFISFCGAMLLAMGLAFEAPLVSYFLARAGWLTPRVFLKRWRHAILACTVLAAVITPTPDVYNMTLMILPLLGLYFVSFAVVWVADRMRKPETSP